jgi:hypothetical protein
MVSPHPMVHTQALLAVYREIEAKVNHVVRDVLGSTHSALMPEACP